MNLTKELLNFINMSCDGFNICTGYDVDTGEVLYSYLNSSEGSLAMLNDWDEGKNNDKYWNDELNIHSVESFMLDMIKELKEKK